MSETNEPTEAIEYAHVDLPPVMTAGALPSSRTEDMLQAALDSTDLEEKNAHLKHIWAHYQSLEFALANTDLNTTILQEFADSEGIGRDQFAEFASKFFLMAVLNSAYETAHQTGLYLAIGFAETVPGALRQLYQGLDYSDPERDAEEAVVVDTDPEDK